MRGNVDRRKLVPRSQDWFVQQCWMARNRRGLKRAIAVSTALSVVVAMAFVSAVMATAAPVNRPAGVHIRIGGSGIVGALRIKCHHKSSTCLPPTTTTDPPPTTTTVPVTTTTIPATTTTTTTQPSSSNCVSSSDDGQCDYPAESYITGVSTNYNCDGNCSVTVDQNVWSGETPPQYSQTLYSTSPADWYVTANTDSDFGGVASYPNTGFIMTGAVNSFTDVTSSWKVSLPTDDTKTAAWAAYDLWFNNWDNEVMIQTDITANSDYECTGVASLTVSGIPWHMCAFGSEDVWKPGTSDADILNQTSGSVDVQAFLVWMEQNGWLPANSTWTAGSFGFEICDTEGTTQSFNVNGFTWDAH